MSISEIPFASLISGGGTTMEALGKACQDGEPLYGKARPMLVISSSSKAAGLAKARALGIPTEVILRREFPSDEAYGGVLIGVFTRYGATEVLQNGWIKQTPPNVIAAFAGHIYNQHPVPVPEFGGVGMYGIRTHVALLDYARTVGHVTHTHAIAQRVAPEFDAGEVVHRIEIELLAADDPFDLQRRVLPLEHEGQIRLLEMIHAGTVKAVKPHAPLARDIHERMLLADCKRRAIRVFTHP